MLTRHQPRGRVHLAGQEFVKLGDSNPGARAVRCPARRVEDSRTPSDILYGFLSLDSVSESDRSVVRHDHPFLELHGLL
jgi:hypothetical protein